MSKTAKTSTLPTTTEAPLAIKAIRVVNAIAINATVREGIDASPTAELTFHVHGVLVVTPTATKLIPFSNLREITLA